MRVLVEMRPALAGHSGIPQETRLMFRGLAGLPGVEVEGLVQSGNLIVADGVPLRDGRPDASFDRTRRLDRLSRVAASLQQHRQVWRFGRLGRLAHYLGSAAGWTGRALAGVPVPLTGFEPESFEDFVWRSLFDKSLPPEDLPLVTKRPLRLLATPWSLAHRVGVATARLGFGLYPRIDTSDVDVFIAETPFPGRVSPRTRLVVRYHDSVPLLLPHTIINMHHHRAAHYHAMMRNVRDGAWFCCVSEATRQELLALMPALEARTATVPNMVSHHYRPESAPPDRVAEIVATCRNAAAPGGGGAPWPDSRGGAVRYLLMVATIEPRKNHATLLEAWDLLRNEGFGDVQLVLVGSFGWQLEEISRRLAPALERGGVHLLHQVPADDLRLLYRHAAATVCPSIAEGFDFPGIEAMRSGGVVVASDIAVHRDVFADGCEYFATYAARDLADALARLLRAPALAEALRARGAEVAERYTPARVAPQWAAFLERVMAAQ